MIDLVSITNYQTTVQPGFVDIVVPIIMFVQLVVAIFGYKLARNWKNRYIQEKQLDNVHKLDVLAEGLIRDVLKIGIRYRIENKFGGGSYGEIMSENQMTELTDRYKDLYNFYDYGFLLLFSKKTNRGINPGRFAFRLKNLKDHSNKIDKILKRLENILDEDKRVKLLVELDSRWKHVVGFFHFFELEIRTAAKYNKEAEKLRFFFKHRDRWKRIKKIRDYWLSLFGNEYDPFEKYRPNPESIKK